MKIKDFNLILFIILFLFLSNCSSGDDDTSTAISNVSNSSGINSANSPTGGNSQTENNSQPDNNSQDGSDNDNSSGVNNGSANNNNSDIKVIFNSNLDSSLPTEWITQYNVILDTLDKRIPVYANNYESLDIYAWNSNTNKPFSGKIGDASGACICGNDQGRYMVLEIPNDEFTYGSMHRYSVIAHEFFHAYQMGISPNFYSGDLRIKWLNEGPAAVFESIYVQEHYDYNYFKFEQDRVDPEATSSPSIFESYDSIGDSNYSSSVFMVLALVKELVKLEKTEEEAIRMIIKDYQELNPGSANWKEVFEQTFLFSVDSFYQSLASYESNINNVLPSESLKLQNIFSN